MRGEDPVPTAKADRIMSAVLDLGLSKGLVRSRWIETLAFLLPLSMYLALPVSTIKVAGLMYYYSILGSDWAGKLLPENLLYCPLMTVLGGVVDAVHPSGVRLAMLLADQLAGAASIYLLFRIAQQLGINRFGQWLAALGLAFSYGFWREATDVAPNAPALLFALASIDQIIRYVESGDPRRLVALGALNSITALFHLGAIFLVATSLCCLVLANRDAPRRLVGAAGTYGGSIALFLVLPVLLIGFGILKLATLGEIVAWLLSWGHGYPNVVSALSIPRALYGVARTFVYLEFFWEAPTWVIALKGLGLVAAGVWATWRIRSTWGRLSSTAKTVLGSLLPFVLLQAVFGIYFLGSDTGGWIFIAPLAWLVLAAHLSVQPLPQRRIAAVGVCLLFMINLVQAVWPAATDSATKARVLALDSLLPAQKLLITPGEDWADYYYYYTSKHLDGLGLLDLAILHRDDHAAFYRDLEQHIADAREAKRPVVMIRVLDPSENYKRMPWQELEALGYPADRFRLWAQRYQWEEQRLSDPERTRIYMLR